MAAGRLVAFGLCAVPDTLPTPPMTLTMQASRIRALRWGPIEN